MLDFALIGVGDADAGDGLGVRAGRPHAADGLPIALIVLHLGPDKVVARVGHGAVGFRRVGAVDGAASDRLAAHHFKHDRVPDLGVGSVESVTVLPMGGSSGPWLTAPGGGVVIWPES